MPNLPISRKIEKYFESKTTMDDLMWVQSQSNELKTISNSQKTINFVNHMPL
jgi:hypothetical protein